jgi:hydroxyacylglutathione hydrolase
MKKGVKRVLLIIGIVILAIILFLGIIMYKINSGTKGMATIQTKKIIKGIYAVNDNTANMYLIKIKDKYIAIDAAKEKEIIKQELKKLNINADDVAAVFLTHTDWDHTGALGLFKNAKIFISKEEEQMINGTTARFFFMKNKAHFKYSTMNDNEVQAVSGIKIKGILTPGHTPGSMCYLIGDQYLFTGDSLSLISGKAGVFSDLFNMDSKTQRESLKKLVNLTGIKYIFTAHHGYTDDYLKAFKDIK